MSGELAWLQAVSAVLSNPSSPMAAQLSSLGVSAQSKLALIDAQVEGGSASLPSVSALVTYAQRESADKATRANVVKFINQVQSLLTQSAPAFQQVDYVFGQLSNVANGGTTSLTIAQVESDLQSIVANRTSLAASARALSAPTGQASTVRNDFAAAMDASLADDQAINTCFNQYNYGTLAFITQSCLSSTASDSAAAMNAKQSFDSSYNALRTQVGLPAVTPSF